MSASALKSGEIVFLSPDGVPAARCKTISSSQTENLGYKIISTPSQLGTLSGNTLVTNLGSMLTGAPAQSSPRVLFVHSPISAAATTPSTLITATPSTVTGVATGVGEASIAAAGRRFLSTSSDEPSSKKFRTSSDGVGSTALNSSASHVGAIVGGTGTSSLVAAHSTIIQQQPQQETAASSPVYVLMTTGGGGGGRSLGGEDKPGHVGAATITTIGGSAASVSRSTIPGVPTVDSIGRTFYQQQRQHQADVQDEDGGGGGDGEEGSGSGNGRLYTENRRRICHNEVERRRREKINKWTAQLADLLPDSHNLSSRFNQSKGGVLEQACRFIEFIREKNAELVEEQSKMSSVIERLEVENRVLKSHVQQMRSDNLKLSKAVRDSGISVMVQPQPQSHQLPSSSSTSSSSTSSAPSTTNSTTTAASADSTISTPGGNIT